MNKVAKSNPVARMHRGASSTELFVLPSIQSAITIHAYAKGFANLEIGELMDKASEFVETVTGGDMTSVERVLAAQMLSLDLMFNQLAQRAVRAGLNNTAGIEMLKLALKAQGQCRTTAEALVSIKNPVSSATFVRQANIGGAVQVNNGMASPPFKELEQVQRNELLEIDDGKRLDSRAARETSTGYSEMATLGPFDRTAHD